MCLYSTSYICTLSLSPHRMAESSKLCSDIIYLLVSQMGTQELLHFSLTCKAFRDPALKQILSSPIEIHDNNQLIHFCACIMTDIHTRAS